MGLFPVFLALVGSWLGVVPPPHFVEKLQDAFDLMNRLDGSEQPEEVGEHGCLGPWRKGLTDVGNLRKGSGNG